MMLLATLYLCVSLSDINLGMCRKLTDCLRSRFYCFNDRQGSNCHPRHLLHSSTGAPMPCICRCSFKMATKGRFSATGSDEFSGRPTTYPSSIAVGPWTYGSHLRCAFRHLNYYHLSVRLHRGFDSCFFGKSTSLRRVYGEHEHQLHSSRLVLL